MSCERTHLAPRTTDRGLPKAGCAVPLLCVARLREKNSSGARGEQGKQGQRRAKSHQGVKDKIRLWTRSIIGICSESRFLEQGSIHPGTAACLSAGFQSVAALGCEIPVDARLCEMVPESRPSQSRQSFHSLAFCRQESRVLRYFPLCSGAFRSSSG